ncbi:hypothetical protein LCGC14_2194620, partial [marine sediment metagenome]
PTLSAPSLYDKTILTFQTGGRMGKVAQKFHATNQEKNVPCIRQI